MLKYDKHQFKQHSSVEGLMAGMYVRCSDRNQNLPFMFANT